MVLKVNVEVILRKLQSRIALIAAAVLVLDQFTKWLVLNLLEPGGQKVVIPGFFRFVLWGNTGAAWSLFRNNNATLALVAVLAFVALYLTRHHFNSHTLPGQIAFGLIFGGIAGNLTDRLLRGEVIDFLFFYLQRRGGGEIGFPAFNLADSAICIGVGLIFLISWKNERKPQAPPG